MRAGRSGNTGGLSCSSRMRRDAPPPPYRRIPAGSDPYSMMKSLRIALILLVALVTGASAQSGERDRLFVDVVPFAAAGIDSALLDVYVAIPYAALTFERIDGRYTAKYHARLRIEGNSRLRYDSTFTRTVQTASYDVSVGRTPTFDFLQQRVTVPPGSYSASLELLDTKSNLVGTQKRDVRTVTAEPGSLVVSGPMLVAKIREEGTGFVLTPMFTDNVSQMQEGYFLFFEAYNGTTAEEFTITSRYRSARGDTLSGPSFRKRIPAGRSQQWVRLPGTGPARGVYTLELRFTAGDSGGAAAATTERGVRFSEAADGMPIAEGELEEKIIELRYVAAQSDIDDITSVENYSERRKKFASYWERLDPTPGTAANEAMVEYYRRIDYANTNYRSYAAGWLTDKGRVYVIYGQPDNISTDSFRRDGRTVETWHYYNRSLRLTFVDDSGFGDFRLVTQIPLGEKYRYPGS